VNAMPCHERLAPVLRPGAWKAAPRLRRFVACRASALALGLSSQMSPDGRHVIDVRRTDPQPRRITLGWPVTVAGSL
jgi:hypothetical protein